MLTRRTFLTTIAAAPLARFCKTEPVRPWQFSPGEHGFIDISGPYSGAWRVRVRDKRDVERHYNLPQGTLG